MLIASSIRVIIKLDMVLKETDKLIIYIFANEVSIGCVKVFAVIVFNSFGLVLL